MKKVVKIKAIIHPAEEGGYWAEVPALPDCITEGDSMDEVINNIQDAIQGWLEVINESQKLDCLSKVIEIAVWNQSQGKNYVRLLRKKAGFSKKLQKDKFSPFLFKKPKQSLTDAHW